MSIIVPLYGRFDFIEFQLSKFSESDGFADLAELIYVLDDPRHIDWLLNYCNSVYPLYRVPFTLLSYGANLGYAGANNAGAQHACAPYLLLMNSDVIPDNSSWLATLLDTGEKIDGLGALGPRLVFADGSIQHDGMRFLKFPYLGNLWINDHPKKGFPPGTLADQPLNEEVQAVTGACMLIRREAYERVGGFDEGYILGDFEESDLCMKLRAEGLKICLTRAVQLYHLERQSQSLFADQSWKAKLTIYNCWRHTGKWNEQITKLVETGT